MKTLIVIFLLLITLSLTGCADENVPEVITTKLVAVNVLPKYGEDENWIIIHDENGALLEYKKFESDEEFGMETTKPVPGTTVGITILKYKVDSDNKRFSLLSYLNLETGKSITLKPTVFSNNPSGAVTGNFSFTVTDYPSLDHHVLSDKFGTTCGSSVNNLAERKLTVNCETTTNTNKYFFQMADASGNLKYKILENVTPGGTYSASYADLSNFDQTVDITFPQTNNLFFAITGRESGQSTNESGFTMNFVLPGQQQRTGIKAGYLNGFSPATLLFLSYPEFSYYYNNIGSLPSGDITWPSKSDFAVNSESLTAFSSTAPSSFKYRQSNWSYGSSSPGTIANWSVYSSSKGHAISGLPAEILTLYPTLKMDGFQYYNTTFFVGTKSYADMIADQLQGDIDFSGIELNITLK
jgi:hypothetical protein